MGKLGWTLFSHEREVKAVAFNKGGDFFVTGGADKLVCVWEAKFNQDLHEYLNAGNITTAFQKENEY